MGIQRATGVLVAALVIAAAAPGAFAQEVRVTSRGDSQVDPLEEKEPGAWMGSLSIQGRVSVPLGGLDINGGSAIYADSFGGGLGVQAEASLLWRLGRKWHIGPYVSLGWDGYDGSIGHVSGDTLKTDPLELATFLVGPRALLQMGRHLQLDLHMAFGNAHYSEVRGTFTPSAGVPQEGVVINASTKFAFDLGIRFHVLSDPLNFDLGIDFRSQRAPTHGDLPVDPHGLLSFGLEFGVGVRF